ncbi:hypothetical protein AOQ84DRAFT_172745 [Glonium stellatum]|uniref:Uncharacterized protein n=1 Tax=Glonium stellatum TaxID=574774 RepID=A0A8E2F7J0_9PEZI|nr:hypothetical protein AOQ84DRAFT_172745 [Glonium stellatum]
MDAHSTIGLLVKAATCWITPTISFLMRCTWLPLISIIGTLTAACGWDRDSRYGASITELHQRPSTPRSVEPDPEKASPIIGISWSTESLQSRETASSKSDNSKRPGTGLSSDQITAGLNGQQRGPVDPTRMHRQVPRTVDDMMLSEILSTCLDERTAKLLSYSMIQSFPKSLRDFLSLLYRRTRGRKLQDIIYTSAFSKVMHDRSDALLVQTIIQANLQDLQDYIKEKGVQNALSWKPHQPVNIIGLQW